MTLFETATVLLNGAYTTATVVLVVIAYLQLKNLREENASRAALHFAQLEATSAEWNEVREAFNEIARSGDLNKPKDLIKSPGRINQRKEIRSLLNRYEVIALGIRTGAISEDFMKRFWRSALISDWAAAENYIRLLRKETSKPKLYSEFEWLRNRWVHS